MAVQMPTLKQVLISRWQSRGLCSVVEVMHG